MNCINHSHEDFQSLLRDTNLDPLDLEMSIAKWQQDNNEFDRFPTIEELAKGLVDPRDNQPLPTSDQPVSFPDMSATRKALKLQSPNFKYSWLRKNMVLKRLWQFNKRC